MNVADILVGTRGGPTPNRRYLPNMFSELADPAQPTRHGAYRSFLLRPSLFVCLALLTLSLGVADAQGAAMIDPASARYTAEPGGSIEGSVRVTNPTDVPMRLRLYLSDWDLDPAGNFEFADPGTTVRTASDWLTYAPAVLELAPQESATVPYTATVPSDAVAGTHRTVLFVESEPGEPEPGQAAATFAIRVGHVVYIDVPPLTRAGAIAGIFGEPPAQDGDPYRLTVLYVNAGNAVTGVEGRFTLRNDRGDVVVEADVDRTVVLPDNERAFEIDVQGPLPAGNYTALIVFDYGDAEQEVAGTYDFTLQEDLKASSEAP